METTTYTAPPIFTLRYNSRLRKWELSDEWDHVLKSWNRRDVALSGRKIEKLIGRGLVRIYNRSDSGIVERLFPAQEKVDRKKRLDALAEVAESEER